jgi:hypothetical protein
VLQMYYHLHIRGYLRLTRGFSFDYVREKERFLPTLQHRGTDKSLARPTSLSIIFSVQGTGCIPTGPDPENRVGDEDTGSPGRPVSSGLQVPGEPFPSWSG